MQFTERFFGLLISGFLCLVLASFVYWQYRKRRIARAMAFTTAFMAGYCWLVAGLAAASTEALALIWLRIFMPFAYLLALSFYRFSMLYSRNENRWTRGYLKFAYAMVAFLTLVKVSGLSNGAKFIEGQGWFPANDPVYFGVYLPFLIFTLLLALSMVAVRIFKTQSEIERNNLIFYFLAFGTAIGLDAAQLYPPLAFLAAFAWFAYACILSYAISRHRLFDLSLVVKKGAMAAGISFALCVGIVALVLKAQEVLVIRQIGFGPFAIVSSALLIAVILPLLWGPISGLVNRIFGVRVLSLEQRLLSYSSLLAKHLSFNDYTQAVQKKLGEDMGLAFSCVLLRDRVSGGFSAPNELEKPREIAPKSALAEALAGRDRPLDVEELLSVGDDETIDGLDAPGRKAVTGAMAELGAAVAVPLKGENALEGILLLGNKASSAIFSARELDFLQALATQVISALENWKLHSQIQQSERLSTLGTLSASLAHELRNPLTSISTFVQMLPAKFGDEAFREKFGRIVGLEISKLTNLTEQLLNFSRPSASARGSVNLWQLAERVRQLLRYQFAKKNVVLEIGGSEQEAWVSGNDAELSQVLVNLLLNALHASEGGSRVAVMVEAEDPRVTLKVVDHGSGMTPEQMRRIFEPFFTTKESGTGLGLPTCQRIVEQHGGTLEVSSNPGEGSVFILSFQQAKILQFRETAAA